MGLGVEERQALLERAERLRKELGRRKVENYLAECYQPHEKQRLFHASKKRIRLFLGGNRVGKTTAGISEAVAHFEGHRPWWPEESRSRIVTLEDGKGGRVPIKRANRGLIVGESFGTLKKVQLPKLLGDPATGEPGLLPPKSIKSTKKNQQGIIEYIRGRQGQEIFLMSYDQEVDLFEGMDLDWVLFDEPPPQVIWKSVWRGLTDRMGNAMFTMTPLKEPWIHDQLVENPNNFCITADTRDNIGYGLTEQKVAEFEAELDPAEREARIQGKFLHLQGLVYAGYDQNVHCIPRAKNPLGANWAYWMHIDPHPRKPHRAVWMAIRPDGTKLVIGELENAHPRNLTSSFAEQIHNYERKFLQIDQDEIIRLIDPISSTPSTTGDGITIADEFSDFGIHCTPGIKDPQTAISLMRRALENDPEAGVRPEIYFFDDLTGVRFELTHYVFEEWKGRMRDDRPPKDTPRKIHDDYLEGIHRILLEDPQPKGPSMYDYQPEVHTSHVGY